MSVQFSSLNVCFLEHHQSPQLFRVNKHTLCNHHRSRKRKQEMSTESRSTESSWLSDWLKHSASFCQRQKPKHKNQSHSKRKPHSILAKRLRIQNPTNVKRVCFAGGVAWALWATPSCVLWEKKLMTCGSEISQRPSFLQCSSFPLREIFFWLL